MKIDINSKIGNKYNRLTVVGISHKDKRHRVHYLCKCDCGTVKSIQYSLLTSGNTKSCGCFGKERRKLNRLPDNRGIINQIILQIKRHAKGRNIDYKLSYELVKDLITKPCYYCADPHSNNKINKHNPFGFKYNGIDRINSSLHYTKDNVVTCCRRCNLAKRDMSVAEFRDWIQRLTKNFYKWG